MPGTATNGYWAGLIAAGLWIEIHMILVALLWRYVLSGPLAVLVAVGVGGGVTVGGGFLAIYFSEQASGLSISIRR